MADNESRTRIILEPDKDSASATQKAIADIRRDIDQLGQNTGGTKLSKTFDEFNKQLEGVDDIFRSIKRDAEAATKAAEGLGKVDAAGRMRDSRGRFLSQGGGGASSDGGGAGDALGDVLGGGGGGSQRAPTGAGQRLRNFGTQLRNLPSQQIPGTTLATDAIGNFARLGSVVLDAAENSSLAAKATEVLTPLLGAQSAATAGLGVAVGSVLVPLALIAAAVVYFAEVTNDNADAINAYADSQRELNKDIAAGLTTEDAKKKLDEINAARAQEQKLLDQNTAAYKQFEKDSENLALNFENVGAVIGGILFGTDSAAAATKALSADEQALADQIAASSKNVTKYDQDIQSLTRAIEGGSLAANDAAAAEKKRKDEEEKAAREAEQKEEQRLRDVESTQKRLEDSTLKFDQKTEDNARQASQKVADIELSLQDKRLDIQQKNRDELSKITRAATRDEQEDRIKALRAEEDARTKEQDAALTAAVDHQRDLLDIRKDAEREEEDQLRERNFLGAALAGEAAQREIDDADLNAKRETQDRALERDAAAAERALDIKRDGEDRRFALEIAREDRKISFGLEQRDAKAAYERQLRDADTNRERQEETTLLGYQREQAQLQEHLDELLGIRAEAAIKEKALATGASPESVLRGGNATTSNSSSTLINDNRAWNFGAGAVGASTVDILRRMSLETMRAVRYS